MTTLKYTDTTDRAFGLGGMAVAMVVWESERFMQSLDTVINAASASAPSHAFACGLLKSAQPDPGICAAYSPAYTRESRG